MFPKLYKSNETNFIHNGLGLLTGTITAVATEELNGMFELNMQYDNDGILADVIDEEMIIKAKANDKQDAQLFRIYSITKNHENDNLIIDAVHITNDLANNFVEKLEVTNLTKRQVMELIGSSTAYPHPFNVTSSNSTTQSSTSLYRTNPLQMIAGMEGSILQIWGGQIERDNFHLIMHDRRGSDDGTLVTYKKNLTGLTAKFDISNLVTRIYPFIFKEATDNEPEKLITVAGKYIDSPHINDYEMPYILPVDFSNEEGVETSQDLLAAASKWFVETGRDKPKVEMEVHFEHLWETEEYKDVAALELVGMGDTITVKHSKLKVEGAAIVNRIEYDVIAEKNLAVDVGNVKAKFTDKVNKASDVANKIIEIQQTANQAITAANGKNTIYYGPDDPTGNLVEGDLWFRVVNGEYTRTYRYDGIQWQLIVSADIKDIEETANEARNQAEQAVANANLATSNALEAISEAQGAFDEAQSALSTADDAERLATTVSELANSLQGTVSGHKTTIDNMQDRLSRTMLTVDADAKFATQSALQQTSSSLSSEIASVQGNLDGLEIGTRNLIQNSQKINKPSGSSYTNISPGLPAGDYNISFDYKINVENIPITDFLIYIGVSLARVPTKKDNEQRVNVSFTIPKNREYTPIFLYAGSAAAPSQPNDVDFIEVMLVRSAKSADWTPAPEDIQSQFSSINQTVSEITTRVGNSEGDISSLQQTSSSLATRIGNAEGNISSLTQTAQGLQTAVSNKADKSTVTQLAGVVDTKITKGQADGWYASQSQLTQTASSLQSTITSVRNDLDGLEIGGRNLIPDSKELAWSAGSGNSSYQIIYRGLERNQTYTISFDAELSGTGNTGFVTVYPYVRSGESMSTLHIPYTPGQRMKLTFTTDGRYDYNLLIYAGRSGSTAGNSIILRNLKLEKGNHATDWQPAPEDLATQSQFTQLSDNINLRVMKDDIINQINVSTESILISGRKLILDGDTTVTGTFRVNNANITSVDAGKMTTGILDAGRVSVVNLSANSITGGILQSQNSNTTFNLNNGNLSMENADFTLGGGANIVFTSAGNKIYYTRFDSEQLFNRTAGFGVGNVIGGRYPFAYVGTDTGTNLDTLSTDFTGLQVFTAGQINTGAATNISSHRFELRNRANGWDRGITFDFFGSPVIRPINGHQHNYNIGDHSYMFNNLHIRRLYTIGGFDIFNNSQSGVGWRLSTIEESGRVALRGLNGGIFNYDLGASESFNHFHFGYINNLRGASGASTSLGVSSNPYTFGHINTLTVHNKLWYADMGKLSDKRLKRNIETTALGLDFINYLNPVKYQMHDKESVEQGIIAQELLETLNLFNVQNQNVVSIDPNGYYGVDYTQLISPTIRAMQELDLKVETEVSRLIKKNEELILKVAKLEERINKLEVAA